MNPATPRHLSVVPEIDASLPDLPVKIIRSAKRRKTLQARVVGRAIEVRVPAGMDPTLEAAEVEKLVARVRSKHLAKSIDLPERATELAIEYGLPVPTSIRWVTNQEKRFGSCTIGQGSIRISTRLVGTPDFVLDHVILHELCHLVHASHSQEFHDLANRHPEWEKAEGYLLAMSHGYGTDPQNGDDDDDHSELLQ